MSLSVKADWIGLDEIKKQMAKMPEFSIRATNSALSTIGYNLKKETKDAVSKNSFGWPKISQMTRMTKSYPPNINDSRPAISGPAKSVSRKLWGSIANLPVYKVSKNTGALLFGFVPGTYGTRLKAGKRVANIIGNGAVELAHICTEGFEWAITSHKVQRYLAALGFPMKMGRVLRIPARPLIGPVFVMCKPAIPMWFRDKFWERIRKYSGESIGAAA